VQVDATAQRADPDGRAARSPLAAYLASFLFLGVALSIGGPALPHLRERAGVGIAASGFVLAGQSAGYIAGSLVLGHRYDRGSGHRLIVGAAAVATTAALALSAVAQLWMVVAVFGVIGFSAAAVDVGGNTLSVWSQPAERVGSTLNGLHLCFGIGALATPLVVSASVATTHRLVLVAVLMAVLAAAMAMLVRGRAAPVRRQLAHHDDGATEAGHASAAFVLLCVFFFVYVGSEVTFAGWVSTYAEQIHLGGDDAPAIVASVFWAGFVLGRIAAIWLTSRMSLSSLLVGSCVVATVATLSLAVGDGTAAVVWVAAGVIGFTLGPQYATMLAFGDQRMRLSGSSTSKIVASSGVGGLTLPIATGAILDRWGASLLPWAVGTACLLTTAVTIGVVIAGRTDPRAQRPPDTSRNAPVT
jgi:FHS family Na+ dependent glucose MFS transporter 1